MRMKFMNTEIDNLTIAEALERIDEIIQENNSAYLVTPNVDHIVQLEKNNELRKAYQNAALILTDGHPLMWISKLYGTPIREKINGADLFFPVCELAAQKNYSVFFLGAAEGVAEKAAENLMKRYDGLKIAGTYSPPYGFEKNNAETEKIIRLIRQAKPHILIVALGCPKQELFMYHHCKDLCVPISMGLGASIDFAAGNVKRAPKWMTNHGLEWLYRTIQEPGRLAKRYFIDGISIGRLILKYWPKKSASR